MSPKILTATLEKLAEGSEWRNECVSKCWAEGWHVGLYCWLKASMALMCLSWDVGVNSAASQEPLGRRWPW